jgi:mRNA interferase MazF
VDERDRRLKRGEIWTAAGGSAYTGKPRPIVILQDHRFDATDSITMCPLTSDPTFALFRIPVEPSTINGLRLRSHIMADKVATIPRSRVRSRVGRLNDREVSALNRALVVFLGLAG